MPTRHTTSSTATYMMSAAVSLDRRSDYGSDPRYADLLRRIAQACAVGCPFCSKPRSVGRVDECNRDITTTYVFRAPQKSRVALSGSSSGAPRNMI